VKRDLEDYLSTLRKDLAENEDSCNSLSNQLDATETSVTNSETYIKILMIENGTREECKRSRRVSEGPDRVAGCKVGRFSSLTCKRIRAYS